MKSFTKEISRKEMASFLIPILCMKLFEQISGITNTAVMSRLLSPQMMVCVSACRVYPMIQNNLIGSIAAGFGVYVTRFIGQGKPDRLREAVSDALFCAGLLAIAGSGLLFAVKPLLLAASIPADIYGEAYIYLFWLFAGSGALVFQNLFLSLLYGLGESAFAGSVSTAGVFLQPFFTFFFVRQTQMATAAVPVAILANRLLLAAAMLCYLLRRYRWLFGRHRYLKDLAAVWKELWGCGFSMAAMLIMVWCGTFMIQRQVNQMPSVYISAYMYAILVEDLFLAPVYACRQAASAILAQNAGAGRTDLVRKYYWRLNRLSWLFCAALIGIIYAGAAACVRLAAGPAPEEVIVCAVRWLRICVFAFSFLSLSQIGQMLLQAVGAYRSMWLLGILEGALRAVLAVTVISGSDFNSLIGAFFAIFLWNGTATGICCHLAMKRMEHGAGDVSHMAAKERKADET